MGRAYLRLENQDHQSLALWAADCAEHVLGSFEKERPRDNRPRRAIEAARAWARGEMTVGAARQAALAAHSAARQAVDPAARAAARSAGHAAATAHLAGNAAHAATYAATAASSKAVFDPAAAAQERRWQQRELPAHLRRVAFIA